MASYSYVPVQLAFKHVTPEGGPGNKEPVIFLHGLAGSKENWDSLVQPIANATKREVYAVDARNHGDSEWTDDYRPNIDVEDLLHFMDKMNIPKAILIGHSMGGLTAIKTALRQPKRVERLVVEDVSARPLPQATLDLVATYLKLAQAGVKEVLAGVDEKTAHTYINIYMNCKIPRELRRPDGRVHENHMALKIIDGRYTFKHNTEVILKALKNSEEPEPLGLFEGPACFIYGKKSPFQVHLDEEYIKKLFPKAKLVGIADAEHNVHFDCPREFLDELMYFLLKE